MKYMVIIAWLSIQVAGCASHPPLSVVERVDVPRYMGSWYEIASLPAWFQDGCYCTQAQYSLLDNGDVYVLNSCREDGPDGELEAAEGVATVVDGSEGAKLTVTFFWPFSGDYWIIALDARDYQYAMVGTPDREYLWILSRTPTMDEQTYALLVSEAQKMGYDTSELNVTDQSCHPEGSLQAIQLP